MLLYTMALTWIKKSDRYCWNNFSQSYITLLNLLHQRSLLTSFAARSTHQIALR